MRIKLATEERRFTIPLPNWLFLNPVSAAICTAAIRYCPEEIDASLPIIEYAHLAKLFAEIKKCREYLGGEPLMTAYSADGEFLEIHI